MVDDCPGRSDHDIAFIPYRQLATGSLAGEGSLLAELANNDNATPAQLALAWLLKRSLAGSQKLPASDTADPWHLIGRAPRGQHAWLRHRIDRRRIRGALGRRLDRMTLSASRLNIARSHQTQPKTGEAGRRARQPATAASARVGPAGAVPACSTSARLGDPGRRAARRVLPEHPHHRATGPQTGDAHCRCCEDLPLHASRQHQRVTSLDRAAQTSHHDRELTLQNGPKLLGVEHVSGCPRRRQPSQPATSTDRPWNPASAMAAWSSSRLEPANGRAEMPLLAPASPAPAAASARLRVEE